MVIHSNIKVAYITAAIIGEGKTMDRNDIGAVFLEKTALKVHAENIPSVRIPEIITERRSEESYTIKLPDPPKVGSDLLEILNARKSLRKYGTKRPSLSEVSFLCFSANGIKKGNYMGFPFKTVPSAGATYPLELVLAVNFAEKIPSGIYYYRSEDHSLICAEKGRFGDLLKVVALGQKMCAEAPLVFIIICFPERTISRYGDRGYRYILIEAGHMSQNLALAAVALGMGSCQIGAFYDNLLNRILGLDGRTSIAIYINTVGFPEKIS